MFLFTCFTNATTRYTFDYETESNIILLIEKKRKKEFSTYISNHHNMLVVS